MSIIWKTYKNRLVGKTNVNIDLRNKKIAAFDLDDTLIKTKSGKTFAENETDWQLYDNSIFGKLFRLIYQNYYIVIITNQKGLKDITMIMNWRRKIECIIQYLKLDNIVILCALKDDLYRKPRTKLWDKYINGNKKKSFFAGDAAGLPEDFSDTDLKFAVNIGIKFIYRDEFVFGKIYEEFKVNYLINFNELSKKSTNTYQFIPNKPEVIFNVGLPASGKSTFTYKYILPNDYVYINQDTYGNSNKCLLHFTEAIKNGKSIIVDNTNLTKESRGKFINIIKRYNFKYRCLIFETPFEVCKHNSYYRNYITNGKIGVIPQLVYNKMKKAYEKPDNTEGFYSIETIKYNSEINDKYLQYYF